VLDEEAVLVAAAFASDGRDAADVQTQSPGRLGDRLRGGGLGRQGGRLDGETLAATVTPDWYPEVPLGYLYRG
jgi:hypothetical protein